MSSGLSHSVMATPVTVIGMARERAARWVSERRRGGCDVIKTGAEMAVSGGSPGGKLI